jgi:hypothetical protein
MEEALAPCKGVDSGCSEIRVQRMENGWVVLGGDPSYRNTISVGHVARTPKELADLLLDWGQRQVAEPRPTS